MPSLLIDLRMGMFLTYPIRKKLVMNPVPDYIPFLFFPLFSVDDRAIILYDAFYWSIFSQHFNFLNKELQVVRVFCLQYVYNRLVVFRSEYSEYWPIHVKVRLRCTRAKGLNG